jgi:23S rRNA (uracil1939-C5)-methyltransferase
MEISNIYWRRSFSVTKFRLHITRLGAKGDGLGEGPNGIVFVPRSIPGDVVLVNRVFDDPQLLAIETPSPYRVPPMCSYFGECGGCVVQEAALPTYLDWKRGLVLDAIKPLASTEIVQPIIDAHGLGRRRISLHARYQNGRVVVGFMQARSHTLVPIEHCPILTEGLKDAPAIARALAQPLSTESKPLDLVITDTESGMDVDIRGHGPMSERKIQIFLHLAEEYDLARVAIHGQNIVERRKPYIHIGPVAVALPPGAFLQASKLGETVLGDLVAQSVGASKKIADLFSGLGTFALRLAPTHAVHAVEESRPALEALDRAARETRGLKPLTTEHRDLFRRPLSVQELQNFDCVVLDPPRSGAEAQVTNLARSTMPRVVSVSCNLTTFTRDAAILLNGGYSLKTLTPVDQFRYSSHLELVGVFERKETDLVKKRRLLG